MATILVVDDEVDAVNLYGTWLTKNGYRVLTASDGQQALHVARTAQPDLILLDVMLPNINGIEVCRRLRADERTGHIPVVLITAYDPAVGRVEALMAGASDYITKPIALKDLAERLRVLLTHEETFVDQSRRLLHETVHAALTIVPCNLAWLLTIDPWRGQLVNEAVATTKGENAAHQFLRDTASEGNGIVAPLAHDDNVLAQVALTGAAMFNLPLSHLREGGNRRIYRAAEKLDLYFVSILPLQIAGTPLGIMLLGSREPRDVETARGQQLLAAVASQAATLVHNTQLMERLAEREAENRRERAFRQTLIDTMGDGLLVYDETGTITFANRRLALMTGYEVQGLEGAYISDLFDLTEREDHSPFSGPLLSKTESFEMDLKRADGSTVPVLAVQAGSSVSPETEIEDRVVVLSDLTEQKAREAMLRKQTQHLHALNRATQAITSTLSLDETIQAILTEASDVLWATMASILLRVPDTDELVFHASVGPSADRIRGLRVPLSEGVTGRVIHRRRPEVATADANGDPLVHPIQELTGMNVGSIAAAPLLVDGRAVGAIEVIHVAGRDFDPADLETLEALAHSAAIAIGNARLYGEAQRHVRELRLLLKANETTSSTLSIEQVVETVARQLIEALSVKWCLVSSWEAQNEALTHLAEVADIVWPADQAWTGQLESLPDTAALLQRGDPVVLKVEDMGSDPELLGYDTLPDVAVLIRLPLMQNRKVIGLAELTYLVDQNEYTSDDLDRARAAMLAWAQRPAVAHGWSQPINLRDLGTQLLSATGAARCTLYEADTRQGTLRCVYETGQIVWALGQGPTQRLKYDGLRRMALIERTPVTAQLDDLEAVRENELMFPDSETGARLIAPLIARGEAIGVVELVDTDPEREFSRGDLSLAQAIGNVVGNTLENARLYSALLRRAAQLEAAYNDLREADRLKAEWIQNVSHELRTPLTSIIGYIDLLHAGDMGPLTPDQEQGLEVLGDKSQKLARLVEDILAIQQMEHEPLDLERVPLDELAYDVIEDLRSDAEAADLEIQTAFADDLPALFIDPDQIRQVFENLLDNAIKFSPDGGVITVQMENLGAAVKAQIIDPGIGIPATEHEKIWRRFYQVDGSMTRQYGGTGLGLAIVKQIVEKHNGRIWVESKPGEGSTFTFILPNREPVDFTRVATEHMRNRAS